MSSEPQAPQSDQGIDVPPPPAQGDQAGSAPRQQQQQGRGRGRGRGRGQGRGSSQRGGRGEGRGRGDGPVSIAPKSGIPYGHVPAFLPGSSSLVEDLDQRILIVLRDGRHIVGIIRSFDQYSNMVLEEAFERKVHKGKDGKIYFSDIPMGVYVVRGDAIVLLGQIAPDDGMTKMEPAEMEEMIENEKKDSLEWDFDKDLQA